MTQEENEKGEPMPLKNGEKEYKRIKVYGWKWVLIDDLFWCDEACESGIYCGNTVKQLMDVEYMRQQGLRLKEI